MSYWAIENLLAHVPKWVVNGTGLAFSEQKQTLKAVKKSGGRRNLAIHLGGANQYWQSLLGSKRPQGLARTINNLVRPFQQPTFNP
jgi:hypothetical protein